MKDDIKKRWRRANHNASSHTNYPKTAKNRIVTLPIKKVRESNFNWKVYNKDTRQDSDYRDLIKSIKQKGQLTPIQVSRDFVIISGHRRYRALKKIGKTRIKPIIEPLTSHSRDFKPMLVHSNKQREKGADEIFREKAYDLTPQKPAKMLSTWRREERQKETGIPFHERVIIDHFPDRPRITAKRKQFLKSVISILAANRSFLPMTIRQIHYQLLNKPTIRNTGKTNSKYRNDKRSYQDLIGLLTQARVEGTVPFEYIHDPTRSVSKNQGSKKVGEFISSSLSTFLKDYRRDLMQSQPNQIVVVCEKEGLRATLQPVCKRYCIPLFIGRGYGSLSMKRDIARIFEDSQKDMLTLLFLGDFDPEGEDIVRSTMASLEGDFNIDPELVEGKKVALSYLQTKNLPPNMEAKASSTRYKGFVEQYGKKVWELDALSPRRLQKLLKKAILNAIDIRLYNQEVRKEKREATELIRTRGSLKKFVSRRKAS